MSEYLFYRCGPSDPAPSRGILPSDVELQVWRPTLLELAPAGLKGRARAMLWGLLHVTRLFANQAYSIILIRERSEIVHQTFVFPRYFRFPFMETDDIQVGDTWTTPAWRGRGLARLALLEARHRAAEEGRSLWYVTDERNISSQRVVEFCGLGLHSRGIRTTRWRLRLLGAYMPTMRQIVDVPVVENRAPNHLST
jgi:GNAT superfamily N-acetyltransferase